MLLAIALILVCILGYLAQSIGLCMVRGVNEWKNGKPEFLLAILFSGVFAWVAALYAAYFDLPSQFKTYQANIWFVVGGIVFGLGTAFNKGCGVSTLSKLSRGDSRMIFTILGWLIGWSILALWAPATNHTELLLPKNITLGALIALSIALFIWAFMGNAVRQKLWLTIMAIGLIAGFVFLFDAKWPPSGLLYKISHAIAHDNQALWPPLESYLLFLSLLIGMFSAAWYSKKFELLKCHWQQWLLHIMAGSLMGIGASLALGGNDSQLLLALPTFSPAGVVAVMGMIVGIRLGLYLQSKFK